MYFLHYKSYHIYLRLFSRFFLSPSPFLLVAHIIHRRWAFSTVVESPPLHNHILRQAPCVCSTSLPFSSSEHNHAAFNCASPSRPCTIASPSCYGLEASSFPILFVPVTSALPLSRPLHLPIHHVLVTMPLDLSWPCHLLTSCLRVCVSPNLHHRWNSNNEKSMKIIYIFFKINYVHLFSIKRKLKCILIGFCLHWK